MADSREGEACPVVEVAGGCNGVERLNAGTEVDDRFGAAGRFHGDGQIKCPVGVVHRGVEVNVAAGEGGAGQGGLAQRTAAGPFLVASLSCGTAGEADGLDRSGDVAEGVGPFPGEVGGVDEPRPFGLVAALDVGEGSLGLGDGMRGFAGLAEGTAPSFPPA
ncbi:MAG: hypothetical protein ACRDTH_27140 [Pseudonocardiaceae bacterium]